MKVPCFFNILYYKLCYVEGGDSILQPSVLQSPGLRLYLIKSLMTDWHIATYINISKYVIYFRPDFFYVYISLLICFSNDYGDYSHSFDIAVSPNMIGRTPKSGRNIDKGKRK